MSNRNTVLWFDKRTLCRSYPSIQSKVKLLIRYAGYTHIQVLQVGVYLLFGLPLTYKQVRDALFRLRLTLYPVRHLGCGWYCLDFNL